MREKINRTVTQIKFVNNKIQYHPLGIYDNMLATTNNMISTKDQRSKAQLGWLCLYLNLLWEAMKTRLVETFESVKLYLFVFAQYCSIVVLANWITFSLLMFHLKTNFVVIFRKIAIYYLFYIAKWTNLVNWLVESLVYSLEDAIYFSCCADCWGSISCITFLFCWKSR